MQAFGRGWLRCGAALVLVILVGSARPVSASTALGRNSAMNGYVTHVFREGGGASMTYYLHVPAGYDPTQRYPLVLLLHGGGESGVATRTLELNQAVLLSNAYVSVWTSPAVQAEWPSFIVVPQVTWPNRWVNVPAKHGSYRLADAPDASLRMAKEIVDAVHTMYAGVDPSRLYITGLSMGGYGVWEAIERWPGYFSAAAPLAGAGDPSRAAALANLPIWAFQGADDTIVPVSGSLDMIAAIRAAGGHPHFTEFAGAGHGIWMNAYSSHGFMSWLFAQRAAT